MNGANRSPEGGDPDERAGALQREIAEIRGDLLGMIGELDRRRHELFDVRLQLRRHPLSLALVAAALLGISGGIVALARVRRRRRARIGVRLSRLQDALERMIARPSRVAVTPGVSHKIAAAAGGALASAVAKRTAQRLLHAEPRKR